MKEEGLQYYYKGFIWNEKRKDEEIILVVRRHWLILLFRMFPLFLMFVGIFLFNLLIKVSNIFGNLTFFGNGFNEDVASLLKTIILMFLWLGIFITWIDYYLDVWIITDLRILNMEQHGLFHREVSELEHSKIQDVTTEIYGLIPTLIDFGYVYVQTAGEKSRFIFKQVPHPVKIRKIIMQLQKNAKIREQKEKRAILTGKV